MPGTDLKPNEGPRKRQWRQQGYKMQPMRAQSTEVEVGGTQQEVQGFGLWFSPSSCACPRCSRNQFFQSPPLPALKNAPSLDLPSCLRIPAGQPSFITADLALLPLHSLAHSWTPHPVRALLSGTHCPPAGAENCSL